MDPVSSGKKGVLRDYNEKPKQYKNVKVWAAQGKHLPVTNAKIKNFKYEQKSSNTANNIPKKDNLVATLPTWGPHFEVSFDVRIESYDIDIHGLDNTTELIRFTSTDKNCWDRISNILAKNCWDRIPGIFARNGQLLVFSQLGTQAHHRKVFSIRPQTWVKVIIKQFMENGNGKVFEESVDNNSTFSQFSSGSMKLVWIQCTAERRVC